MAPPNGLENRRSGNVTVGSNPTLSANFCGISADNGSAYGASFTPRSTDSDGAQVGTPDTRPDSVGQAHTPGPWVLKQFGGPQISGPDGYAVCTMWGALSVSELEGQDAANARLIAAAPDLLAALQALFSSYKSLADSGDAGYWSLEDQPEGKQAIAAIAKAKGGQP